ncbi:acetyl-CoA carboxylase biotin carboxyl carrier protein subunit [Seonamhaeicola sp. ML3]|uniref:acetyl-CoA carboxylase biotin carboxyl carrier protein subunit n=1 Tax=Seonamhaeicola sp. ML3 TaxID=2937786 RepID=UPI00200D64F3|nr:acetyl-CoA carboxylase biotin carboxyl carrier protein subunit [Seonamhaeicola sp. ML3]
MNKHFKAKVNAEYEFEINSSQIEDLDAFVLSETSYHIIHDDKSIEAEIVSSNFDKKSYQIKINNTSYNVDIHDDLDLLIKKMGFASGNSQKINSIKAPMPGLILEINVKAGQTIEENDNILILEAMKMENVITSPRDGIVKSVHVKKGDAVDKNHLLIEFE